ncbi:MAG TPA: winged helix-turn-helix domain-containing protein [Gaiellaceae bacterium]|nr:winged helix-turn-helix domain-containing protein [Gaiellaceae bacterium]
MGAQLMRSTQLEELADRAPDIIYRYRVRPTRGFDYVNGAATRVTGFTPEEHYADPDLGFKLVHPDDRTVLSALTEAPSSAPVVLRWVRKDGTTIWTEQRNTPVYDASGRLAAIEGIAREIEDPTRAPGATIRLVGDLRIDLALQRVFVDGRLVRLTPSELRLLTLLAEHPGEVHSREAIMRHLWQSAHVGNKHTCETHISSLRHKIERDPRRPERILTVRGRGYTFAAV